MARKHAVGIPLERLAHWDPESEAELRSTENGVFQQVLGEVVAALEGAGVVYALMGGIASNRLGRPRWTHDIDVFVQPGMADAALDALAQAGFDTERTDPVWLFKAFKQGVLVDVIFHSTGGFYLDDEMIARSVERELMGHRVRLIAPEDLLVIKAAVHDERGPRHWHDALGVIGVNELDWEYVLRRARMAPRRVLSLLVYAHSLDMAVPNQVVRDLYRQIYES
ncbi:MAG TPA: nucleotidyltransferase [Gammaproteobacteria bacterium]